MAKDPAFLFYDADAARDVSHLNRLERGCYFDIMQAQKKFGRMKTELIQKVLGKDYDTCWRNLEISLYCENGYYYIPWLEESILKRKRYCASRGRNRLGPGNKKPGKKEDGGRAAQPGFFNEKADDNSIALCKFTVDDLKNYLSQARAKKEQIAMLYNISPGGLEQLIARFCLKENDYANRNDALAHFLNWLDRQTRNSGMAVKSMAEQWLE
jgi:hypothetical protein